MGKFMQPGIIRSPLRAKTAPPRCLSAVRSMLARACDIRIPETRDVQRHLAEGGASVTLMDVALGIVTRIMDSPGANSEELVFVCDCLKADRSKTALPCALVVTPDGTDGIGNILLTTYADTPKSAMSHSVHFCPESDDEEEPASPWPLPSLTLNKGIALELEELMDSGFDCWGFDAFKLSKLTQRRQLQFVGWEAMRRINAFSKFDIAPEKAQCFLRRVEARYLNEQAIPYHNNLHAADVTQSVHAVLGEFDASAYLDDFSCLVLILSAIVHDMGHDGHNNTFHSNVQDELALTYNDSSILENYHISQAFKLLSSEPEANLLSGLTNEQFACARKQMIEEVLGTDIARHFSNVSSFKKFAQKRGSNTASWRADSEATSSLRVMILHAADIAGPAKPAELSDRWADLLKQELFLQGDEEKRIKMPVSPLCDRKAVNFASSQVGFIQFIVQPTFEALAEAIPRVNEPILTLIHANTAAWEERKAGLEEH